MRHFPAKAVVLIALTIPLGACNSFLGIHFARHAPRAAPMPEAAPAALAAAAAVRAESATSVGRRQLGSGQTGIAIESFQRALASGESIAPAVNGLGVAYARLERFDLAQRYFEQAMASDPTNPQYAENLTRLIRSPVFAMRRDGDIVRVALQAAVISEVRAQSARTADAAPAAGKLQRVSRGEVRIATAAPQSAPMARGQTPIDKRRQPLIRVAIARAEPSRAQSFVRIVLPEATSAGAGPTVTGR